MKKIEIEIAVPRDFESAECFYVHRITKPEHWERIKDMPLIKVKAIIELPDRKIEIKESDFDSKLEHWQNWAQGSNETFTDLVKRLKKEFFTEDN